MGKLFVGVGRRVWLRPMQQGSREVFDKLYKAFGVDASTLQVCRGGEGCWCFERGERKGVWGGCGGEMGGGGHPMMCVDGEGSRRWVVDKLYTAQA